MKRAIIKKNSEEEINMSTKYGGYMGKVIAIDLTAR